MGRNGSLVLPGVARPIRTGRHLTAPTCPGR